MILYIPFGAFGGFVSVALTFLATKHGLSITEGALLNGAQLLTQWLKWLWAPIVDITLTPKRWFVIATTCSSLALMAMAAIPLAQETLPILLAVIAVGSLINSIVGMAIEAIMAKTTAPDEVGRVSAWFQAGNLGGAALGGGLGLKLLETLPDPWMSGAILGLLFMATCLVLLRLPDVAAHEGHGIGEAVKGVVRDLRDMLKTKGGLLAAILCGLPVGTGAAQVVLTQANVAAYWGATSDEIALVQGLFAGFVTAAGCFAGGVAVSTFPPAHGLRGHRHWPRPHRERHGAVACHRDDVHRLEPDILLWCGHRLRGLHSHRAQRHGQGLGGHEVQHLCVALELPDLVAWPFARDRG